MGTTKLRKLSVLTDHTWHTLKTNMYTRKYLHYFSAKRYQMHCSMVAN